MKRKAFTLAELIVVMGIIGVVAALVLPNLSNDTSEMENVAKARKVYSELEFAYDNAVLKYGSYDNWPKDTKKDRIAEFLDVQKDCGEKAGCWSEAPKLKSDGTQYAANSNDALAEYYKILLADGASIAFPYTIATGIWIDIDGPTKGETKDGSDIFYVNIFSDANNPLSLRMRPYGSYPTYNTVININYHGLLWVIENGNQDYFKCLSTLKWQTVTSCK